MGTTFYCEWIKRAKEFPVLGEPACKKQEWQAFPHWNWCDCPVPDELLVVIFKRDDYVVRGNKFLTYDGRSVEVRSFERPPGYSGYWRGVEDTSIVTAWMQLPTFGDRLPGSEKEEE